MPVTLTADNPESAPVRVFQGDIAPTPMGRKRWTQDESDFLRDAGLLSQRFQLLDGEIVLQDGHRTAWTRLDCEWLETAGLLRGRYELLDGGIVIKMGQSRPHALVISLLFAYLIAIYGPRRVQMQATMEVLDDDRGSNRPEPDALALRTDLARIPTGEDALLAVEVSDTTQGDDFGPKARLYARAGVEEYWVLDLRRRILVALRHPEGDMWSERQEYAESDFIAPLQSPESQIRIADLLP